MKSKRPISLTQRVSSITNSFVQCLLPDIPPSPSETEEALKVLGQRQGDTRCVYCDVPAADADHLRPLVQHRRPTGYLNDARNRVPACNTCNTSKGNQDWRRWMKGTAKQGLRSRGFGDAFIEDRVAVLDAFVAWGDVKSIDFEQLVGSQRWTSYWDKLTTIENLMIEAQIEATRIRSEIMEASRDQPS